MQAGRMSSFYGKLKSPRSLRFHQDTPKVGTHSIDERVKVAGIRFELKKKIIHTTSRPIVYFAVPFAY